MSKTYSRDLQFCFHNAAVQVAGNGDVFGRVIGQTLNWSGNGKFHFDKNSPGASEQRPLHAHFFPRRLLLNAINYFRSL